MAENPYESGQSSSAEAGKTRATRWLIWLGLALIALGVASVYLVIRGVYNNIMAGPIQPKPSDLANGIFFVQLAHLAVLPLFFFGLVLIIAGFLVRKPVEPARKSSEESPPQPEL